MILTYKIKHNQNLSIELEKGRKVALFALNTKSRSSKDVKHIGLKSAIANQILKKYSSNKKLKKISSVKLTIPSQSIKIEEGMVKIPYLKMEIDFNNDIEKINQIELDKEFAYISCTVKEEEKIQTESWIGVDLNTTGHCLVASDPKSKKVLKLGKSVNHTHRKYKNMRRRLQKKKKFKSTRRLKNKESRIDPKYTSRQCSKCGLLGERNGKLFKCSCGHVENADVNAPFVISLRHQGILQSPIDRDVGEGHLACPSRIVA